MTRFAFRATEVTRLEREEARAAAAAAETSSTATNLTGVQEAGLEGATPAVVGALTPAPSATATATGATIASAPDETARRKDQSEQKNEGVVASEAVLAFVVNADEEKVVVMEKEEE